MLVLKWLHILSMFASVTLLFVPDIVLWRASAAGDVATIRRIGPLTKGALNVGITMFFVGVGFGLLTVWQGGFDFFSPWLITAYVLVAILIVLGAAIESPHLERIGAAAERSGGEPSAELRALLRSPIRYVSWVSVALYAAVIYVMVSKPFS